jgi:hypothetical protein
VWISFALASPEYALKIDASSAAPIKISDDRAQFASMIAAIFKTYLGGGAPVNRYIAATHKRRKSVSKSTHGFEILFCNLLELLRRNSNNPEPPCGRARRRPDML